MNPYLINPLAAARNTIKTEENSALKKEEKNNNPEQDKNLFQEVSWSETDVLQSYLPFANNPDPIVRSKGLKIYSEMLRDDQVKVCIDVRIQARLSTPWEIVPGKPGNATSEEMADFIKECLKRMHGNFESDMEQMFSSISYGFSISEKVFEYIERGRFKGKVGLKAIKVREPYNYDFKVDAHGNLLGLVYIGMTGKNQDDPQILSSRGGAGYLGSLSSLVPQDNLSRVGITPMGTLENPFPPEKFIVYSYNIKFGNHYGNSDFLGAFPWWLMKKHGRKFWAIWLERYASPFLVATYKRDAGLKAATLTAVDDFIRNMTARQGLRVSDAWTITPVQFNSSNNDSYEKAIEAYNRYIAHSILFPNLLGFTGGQGSSGGSYSLGQKQFDSFLWILNKMGRDMSETVVGEQIIKQLIEINYGEDVELEDYPKFKFISIEDASIDVRSQIIHRLGQAGFVSPEEVWVREFLAIPKKDVGIVLPNPKNLFDKGTEEEKPGNDKKEEGDDSAGKKAEEKAPKEKEEKVSSSETDSKMAEYKERDPDFFEKKIRVKSFKESLDSLDKEVFADMSQVIEAMRDEILEKVDKKRLVSDADTKETLKLNVNAKDLNDVLSKWMVKIFLDSKLAQLEELSRAGITVEITRRFAESYEDWIPLPPKDAMDFFGRKVTAKIVDEDGVKKIIDLVTGDDITFLKNRAFSVTGMVRDDIVNDAKQIILNGIKRGSEIDTTKDLKDMFNRYLDQGIAVDGDLLKPSRLRTIVRTNVTEALNEGRASMINDPDIKGFVQFFEYSAILDERTTEYCQCMDGRVFRVEDMGMLRPPAHYNCRSIIVPITQFEVDERRDSGEGIEVDDPCPGRMNAFSDLRREPLAVKNADPSKLEIPIAKKPEEILPAKKSQSDVDAMEKLKKELAQIITRCPYTVCQSDRINLKGRKMNIGEYVCEACMMPFRISTVGDLYLYDAGIEQWEKVSIGILPKYFKDKN